MIVIRRIGQRERVVRPQPIPHVRAPIHPRTWIDDRRIVRARYGGQL